MKTVIIETPYAGRNFIQRMKNIKYARRAMKDSLDRGESPVAFHLLYTQVLRDEVPKERLAGIKASAQWYARADAVAVYLDRGMSPGMKLGVNTAKMLGRPVVYRHLDPRRVSPFEPDQSPPAPDGT